MIARMDHKLDRPQQNKRQRLGTLYIHCPHDGARMYAGSSLPRFTRFYCPRCGHSQKVARPD